MATNASILPQIVLTGSAAITAGTTQTQAGGTPITAAFVAVTTGTASDGITLPLATPGQVVLVQNLSAVALKIYPPVGGVLNRGSANAAVTLTASKWSTVVYLTTTDAAVTVA